MSYLLLFFAGALLCNCLPHLCAGLQGVPFPTPFSKPRGVGPSSPPVNVLWGAVNLVAGLLLLAGHPPAVGLDPGFAALMAGGLVLGIPLAVHFGKVRRDGGTTPARH